MAKKNISLNIWLAVLGIALLAAGGLGMKLDWFGEIRGLPGVLIGVGAGVFGANLGVILQAKTVERDPAAARRIEIEQRDERNQAINNIAKSRAFDAMVYIYAAAMLVCVLINVDVAAILILVAAYLLVHGIMLYEMVKLTREM